MEYGIEYYLNALNNKSREDIRSIKDHVSLKLRETNALLAESRQDHLAGRYSDRREYTDLCQAKASLEAQLEATKQALNKKLIADIKVVSAEDCRKEFNGLSDDILTSKLMDLQLDNTRLNLEIEQAKLTRDRVLGISLKTQKHNVATQTVVIQQIMLSRKSANNIRSKDPEKKVHTAEAYDTQAGKLYVLLNVVRILGRSLDKDEFEHAIAMGAQDFFNNTRLDLSPKSFEILHEWCDLLPSKLHRPA